MKTLFELKKYAKLNKIPIIRPQSQKILRDLCLQKRPNKILEIGTAIGFSGSVMLSACPKAKLMTIEKDENMVQIAKQTFQDRKIEKKVEIFCDDAFEVLNDLRKDKSKFDFIFLDGPKGQYFKYLPILKDLLNKNGCLLADDIIFHGYVLKEGDPGHKHRTIVASLRAFIRDLENDKNFKTQFLKIEDGLLVCDKLN